jgi:succinoglycan biosynthesis protein ExoM
MIAHPTNLFSAGQAPSIPHLCVCICTYKRPLLLQRLLEKLQEQETGGAFTFSAVVADNDAARSAESLVTNIASRSHVEIRYCNEPRKNIALVRNAALANAKGEFIAFIDDDEFPVASWLAKLLQACETYKASGVLGPVRPHFDEPPPAWLVRGRFCERPEHETGMLMVWTKCRTGNVLFRRSILSKIDEPFKPEFGTGGEDQDFFRRASEQGCTFVWCNEAVAYESVPPSRWTRSYMCKRALLRGRNGLKHPTGRALLVSKSIAAVPGYLLLLPVTLLLGQHVFVKYAVKFCDHFGRLLALLHLNPIDERQV